jgi:hypothetical protein
MSITDLSPEL